MSDYGKAFSDFWSGGLRLDGTVPQTPFIVPKLPGGAPGSPTKPVRDLLQGGVYLGFLGLRQGHLW